MKNKVIVTLLCAFALSATTSSQAKIYKWTDKGGVVHYTATPPPPETNKIAEDIESKILFSAGRHVPTKQTSTEQKQTKKEKLSSKLSAPDGKLVAYCRGQRTNLSKLKSNYRTSWKENGVITNLDQKQRKSKVEQLIKSIQLNCKGIK